ncbi:MAG: Ribosomal RNA small subunit methyltransferase E [Elusimicrobia bacterium ADurb.Bin231]|nr:MAG: Ribosomal RNA small subunit methyltransferase E [Elusimicrobia bacterium ADurb.Bin231]
MRRFYIENIDDVSVIISGSEAHHIKNVLRFDIGAEVLLFDGKGKEFKALIQEFLLFNSGPAVKLKIVEEIRKDIESKIKINLFQSIPKFKKFDFIIEKSTELGVDKIIPVISERSSFDLSSVKISGKLSRWRKIAVSAAGQCGRILVPEVVNPTKFADAVNAVPRITGNESFSGSRYISIIPWECEQETSLKQVLKHIGSNISVINLFVGSEGGFSNVEIELAEKNGIVPVSLGKRILRVETAAIAVMANLFYEFEQ